MTVKKYLKFTLHKDMERNVKDVSCCLTAQATHDTTVADRIFLEHAELSEMKRCPNCRFWVERTEGCDGMMCRCGQSFCYSCGGEDCSCSNSGYETQEVREEKSTQHLAIINPHRRKRSRSRQRPKPRSKKAGRR
mmetsp:Transcript_17089/g.19194  ORF Transcript_17089/g.19194 Transcript_17089/m.19194 type:complete len:135 (+) Transcript_17089:1212-1616(+)